MTRLMNRVMARALAATAILTCAVLLPARADNQSFETIEHGRALVTMGDCVACHTAPGGAPFAGGLPIETPFGRVVSPNITPDVATGLGAWTDAEFTRAMQQGIGREGEHLYPAFPYPYYTRITPRDLLAIRAYLGTLTPVSNAVLRNQLPFPFDIRMSMIGWNTLFFSAGTFAPSAAKSAEWNRGAYLVEGLGHCGACHTAKNMLGGDKASQALQGGAVQDWFAPSLGGDLRTGLGDWSVDEIVEYLATGRNARAAAAGPMGEVVRYSTSHVPQPDLHAMAVYLKDQPAATTDARSPVAASDPTMQAGAAIYADNCAACHTGNGAGIPRMFPALKGNASVQSGNPASLLHVVLVGAQAAATDAAPTGPAMPPFGWKLTDGQIASVLTYIRNSWGNAAAAVTTADAAGARGHAVQ